VGILDGRLRRLEARLSNCPHARRLVVVREGEPEPGPFPPCPTCGREDCGVVVIVEQIIVAREPDGTLVTSRGTRISPRA